MVADSICRIQIMSDLHLETHPSYEYDFPQTAPYLALLGDIGHVATEHLIQFLVRQLLRYRVVFFLLGNHEPYHISMDFAKERMNKFVRNAQRLRSNDPSVGEFVFLEKTRFDLTDEITIIGCTLFTNVPSEHAAAIQSRLVDFRDILHWDVGDHVEAHLEDLRWLNTQVSEIAQSGRKVVIFTHHSPCADPRARNPRYPISEVDSGFVTDLSSEECWTNPAVVLWGFGHTHYSCDFTLESGLRVVANQKGYYLIPQKAFRPEKAVEIEARKSTSQSTSLTAQTS
ncbi:ser/Thr protein phosphatase [Dissoconium aciculare CBS 342.82]|uniref:Ser/Thr protein phosphatase n=1 Tax=Dissoconium aciculare CBS 342.82 TaxID=1314786 RepID=A0A6J3MEJ0_9PEZI|nr:ser/Thr protein phosphatase [Dissoconium aciculare CBS 342.82]KAF1826029.1 ser/Thr protein phosphatase [Dissoconium aciculare CBS 342.82]